MRATVRIVAHTQDSHLGASRWFNLAALAGALHAAITLYWALGGSGLLWTMGEDFVTKFSDTMWVLFPLAFVKGLAAVAPTWLNRHGWPARRVTRAACWLGSVVLMLWGGTNTLVGNAVLVGAIRPSDGFDRSAMIGHAWIWDPLFLIWGMSLAVGMWLTRRAPNPR